MGLEGASLGIEQGAQCRTVDPLYIADRRSERSYSHKSTGVMALSLSLFPPSPESE
jgi:hypothetical protein